MSGTKMTTGNSSYFDRQTTFRYVVLRRCTPMRAGNGTCKHPRNIDPSCFNFLVRWSNPPNILCPSLQTAQQSSMFGVCQWVSTMFRVIRIPTWCRGFLVLICKRTFGIPPADLLISKGQLAFSLPPMYMVQLGWLGLVRGNEVGPNEGALDST